MCQLWQYYRVMQLGKDQTMGVARLVTAVFLLFLALPAAAQEWATFESIQDGFSVNFPGKPAVQEIKWPSEYGAVFPGRVYSVQNGPNRFSVTVVDYRDAEKIHAALAKTDAETLQQGVYWQVDIQASIQYAATTKFRQREGAKVTYDAWHYIDLVEGHQLQLTNADQSRTFAGIYLHDNRLYILEATVPPRAPQPGLFQQSLSFLDDKGQRVRYREIYSNRLPPRTLK